MLSLISVERFRDKPLVLTSLCSRERAKEMRKILEDVAFIRETDVLIRDRRRGGNLVVV